MFADQAKKSIDVHTVISFDIFDTLLVRPYLRPSDLFIHLEKIHKLPYFAQHRRQAEKAARSKQPLAEDITYDDIYAELTGEEAQLKQAELDLERQILQPNPVMLELFKYAKQQGKKIIITSDMYLPADFLETVLREKGFDGFDKLYVSNAVGKTKHSGSLYSYIQEDLHANSSDFLHIGDNQKSDIRHAQKARWDALYYPQAQKQYFSSHTRERKFWNKYPSFDASITLGVLVLRQLLSPSSSSYFNRLGYEVAGPTAYGFTRWIEQQAENNHTSNILFAARDGYTLHRVFETFGNKHLSAEYIYALRSILTVLAKQEFAQYNKYLSSHIKHPGTVAIVDSITHFFSAQKLIEMCVGKANTIGYYWSVVSSKASFAYRFNTFLPPATSHERSGTFTHCWNFMEFLFTAPEPPVKDITSDGHPVYSTQISLQEKLRIQSYQKLSDGCVRFAADIKRILGGQDIFLSAQFCLNWVNWFLLHPTSLDKQQMSTIFHASDSDHTQYVPLLSYRPTWHEVYTNLKQYIRFSKQTYWKTPAQFLITHILSPVAIEKRAPGQVALCLFPRLRKQYVRVGVSIGNYWCGIAWGRRKD